MEIMSPNKTNFLKKNVSTSGDIKNFGSYERECTFHFVEIRCAYYLFFQNSLEFFE